MLQWCDWARVDYVVGLARNSRLESMGASLMDKASLEFATTGQKQRLFEWMEYGAATWDCERRVIAKAKFTEKGKNPRFLVTSLEGYPQEIYDKVYCARGDIDCPQDSPKGEAEPNQNRIKEQQLGVFSDRTSAHRWWANQFRVLLSAAAYVLLETIRLVALEGTELAKAQVGTIRLKLLKIGTVILRNTRRIRPLFASGYPYQELFRKVALRLGAT